MKKLACFPLNRLPVNKILPILFLALLFSVNISAEVVDKVVAVVNDEVITLSELEEEMAGVFRSISQSKPEMPVLEVMEKAREIALDGMIEQSLLQQKAKNFNITVPEEDVDAAYERVRNSSSLSQTEFRKKLEESGLGEEVYRKRLRTQILQSRLVSSDVRSRIVVTEEMILDYYDDHYTSKVDKGSFYLLQIGCSWSTTDDPAKLQLEKEQTRERTERIYNLAKKGQDFRDLAKKFSELPSASDGGDIGVFALDEMAKAMRDAVSGLKPGELSEITETSTGYQFFKSLSGKEDAIVVTTPLESVKEEIKEKIFEEKLKTAYPEWVRKLKEDAYIQKL